MTEIALALITLAGTIICGLIATKKDGIKNQVLHQELLDRIKVLERKIDIHNGYAKKFSKSEKSIAEINVKILAIKERLNEILCK